LWPRREPIGARFRLAAERRGGRALRAQRIDARQATKTAPWPPWPACWWGPSWKRWPICCCRTN